VAKKKTPLSTVVAFMSPATQNQLEAQSQGNLTLPLAVLLPDFSQPRRLLPDDLVEAVKQGDLAPLHAFQGWEWRSVAETADIALKRQMEELKRLATTIEQHGLISPISVRTVSPDEIVPDGVTHIIVTGERRYWAHIYLVSEGKQIQEGQERVDPSRIKVSLAAAGVTIKAHQLIENLLREDMNAVEKARGFWALRYELSEVEESVPPAEAEMDDEEVNYSSPHLVPWSRVEETLNLSKRYRIFVTSILNLSEEAQALVAAHNLAEMTIRPIVQKLRDRPDLQVRALQQVVVWQAENEAEGGPGRSIVASVKELVERLLAEETAPPRIARSVSSAPAVRFRQKVRQTLDFLNRLKTADREDLTYTLSQVEFVDVVVDLRNLQQQIETMLHTIDDKQPPAETMTPPEENQIDE
jgi:ParB-like chromosome segregation protein Spo0J